MATYIINPIWVLCLWIGLNGNEGFLNIGIIFTWLTIGLHWLIIAVSETEKMHSAVKKASPIEMVYGLLFDFMACLLLAYFLYLWTPIILFVTRLVYWGVRSPSD